ncbi:MAG: hypothetical protein CUN55_21405, partial [Phototrophicales bacterium]
RWGYSRKIVELYEPLRGKIQDAGLAARSIASLGAAYFRLGETHLAIECCKEVVKLAAEAGDKDYQSLALSRLGITYRSIGRIDEALETFEQALEVARAVNS